MEDVILKIQKLLAVGKSPNRNEAQNAMIIAQKLLAQHKLSQKEVEEYQLNNVIINEGRSGIKFRGASWKSNLANVIASNFGCYLFLRTSKTHEICFYGKEEDVIICDIILNYSIKCINCDGDKLIKKLKQDKRRKHFKGIKDDYALGFIYGLNERFKAQINANKEWGLVLLKDQIVIDKFNEFSANFGGVNSSKQFDKHDFAFKIGKEDGKKFDISNKIESDNEDYILIKD